MGGGVKVKRIAGAALLIVLSPAILVLCLIFIIVQIPSSIVDRRRRARRQRSFEAQMAAAGRLIPWAELRSQLAANSEGTLIEEDAEDDLYNVWWTPEDVAALSPHPCCFEPPSPKTRPDMEGFRPFFEWCRSRFTSPESGTALLVDVGKDFWSFFEGTKGRPCVHVNRLP
jgi:hypothetical protein